MSLTILPYEVPYNTIYNMPKNVLYNIALRGDLISTCISNNNNQLNMKYCMQYLYI